MGYPKQVYEKAWDTLEKRKKQARDVAAKHRAEAYARIPALIDIEKRMSAAAAAITKSVVVSPGEADMRLEELAESGIALQNEREKLLVDAGYPSGYLREKYTCSLCGDSGYIGTEPCKCFDALLKSYAHTILGGMAVSGDFSFDSFSLDYYPDAPVDGSGVVPYKRMGEILAYCKQYAKGFGRNSESLLLMGQTGLGKTHMSLAIASAVTDGGYGVVYQSAQKLLDKLESEKFSRAPESKEHYNSSIDVIMDCDLLILDDLGAEFFTPFTVSVIYNIVNTRIVERKPVIINTNLELAMIEEKYSQRMASRLLCEYKVLKFFGKDIRYLKKYGS